MECRWVCPRPRWPKVTCSCARRMHASIWASKLGNHDARRGSIKRLPARIERIVALSHDVMGWFSCCPGGDVSFEAGQYIDIMLPGGRRRSFSIASPPHDANLLELHVRRVTGGEFQSRCSTRMRKIRCSVSKVRWDSSCIGPAPRRCCWWAAARASRRCSAFCGT